MSRKRSRKIESLPDAVRMIDNGDSVTFNGVSISSHPVAITHEIIRQKKRNLEIAGSAAWFVNNMLIGAGCVKRMIIIADSSEIGGVAPALSRAVENGLIEVEDYSFYAAANRFKAAAIGVPFLPLKSMLGSDMLQETWLDEGRKFRIIDCPFSGEKVVLVPPLKPDVAVIHAHRADEEGNVQIYGPTALVDEQARASEKVIVTVENIIESKEIIQRPELTVIPSFIVDAVVEVPYGAHPTAMHASYDYDLSHLDYAFKQSKDEKLFKNYLEKYVYRVCDHMEYLDLIGGDKRLRELKETIKGW